MEDGMMERGAQEERTGFDPESCVVYRPKKKVEQKVEEPVEKTEQNVGRPVEKVKPNLGEIVVDEGEIMKEFDEPVQESQAELSGSNYAVGKQEKVFDMSICSALHPRTFEKSRDEAIAEIVEQEERGKYFSGDWMSKGRVAQGRRCVVERVVNDSGLEAAFKGVHELSGRKDLDALKKEARIITELAKEGSKYTPAFAISDVHDEENPGIYTEFGPLSKEAVMNLSVEEKLRLIEKMADPIARLHAKGHCLLDIKLENYRFRENGDPMFVDIESRRASGLRELSQSIVNSMSMGGEDVEQAAKTLICMAPELAKGSLKNIEGKEHLADVYSLGVSLYGLLMGEYPLGVRPENLTDNIELIRELGEEKAKCLNDYLMEKVFSKDSSKRPQSVEEFVSGLREVVGYFDDVEEVEENVEEVRKEKVGDLEKKVDKVDVGILEVAGESAQTLGRVLKGVGKATGWVSFISISSIATPSSIRILKNDLFQDDLSMALLASGVANFGYWMSAGASGNIKEALTAYVVGNAISGGYEFVRSQWKKVKAKKENALEKILERTGLSLEEYNERKSKQKQVYRDLKKGDFSMLVNEGSFSDDGYINRRGFEIFRNQMGSEYRSLEDTCQAIIETGLAYDEKSAKKVMEIINERFGLKTRYSERICDEKGRKLIIYFDEKKLISVKGKGNQSEVLNYALKNLPITIM